MNETIEETKIKVKVNSSDYIVNLFYKKGEFFAENFINDSAEVIRFICRKKIFLLKLKKNILLIIMSSILLGA